MAEIEISIFQQACLFRRVTSIEQLSTRINELELERNRKRCTISWQFTTNDARNKLQELYPDTTNKQD